MSVLATGGLAAEAAPTVLDDRRRSTSNHRSDDGTFSRNARVSSPAPRLSTVRAPFAMARSTASSISRVRTISAQPSDSPNGSARRIAVPRSPAMRRACGSWKRASGRSDSIARYIATQRAVSETSRIEPGVAEVRRLAFAHPHRSSRAEVHVRQRVRHVSMFSYSQALSLRLTVGVLQERSMPAIRPTHPKAEWVRRFAYRAMLVQPAIDSTSAMMMADSRVRRSLRPRARGRRGDPRGAAGRRRRRAALGPALRLSRARPTGGWGPRVADACSRCWAALIKRVRFEIAIRIRRLTTVRFIGLPLFSNLVSGGSRQYAAGGPRASGSSVW
jgi:hypothetical protein